MLPPNLVVAVALVLWPGLLLLHYEPPWIPTPWIHNYGVLHQMGWWAYTSFFHFGSSLTLFFWVVLAPPE